MKNRRRELDFLVNLGRESLSFLDNNELKLDKENRLKHLHNVDIGNEAIDRINHGEELIKQLKPGTICFDDGVLDGGVRTFYIVQDFDFNRLVVEVTQAAVFDKDPMRRMGGEVEEALYSWINSLGTGADNNGIILDGPNSKNDEYYNYLEKTNLELGNTFEIEADSIYILSPESPINIYDTLTHSLIDGNCKDYFTKTLLNLMNRK